VTIDPVRRYAVVERAAGPFRWGRRVYREVDVLEARTHDDSGGFFAALHFGSGATAHLYPWSTRDRRPHDRFVAELNELLGRR
jgi:hypothetical protein